MSSPVNFTYDTVYTSDRKHWFRLSACQGFWRGANGEEVYLTASQSHVLLQRSTDKCKRLSTDEVEQWFRANNLTDQYPEVFTVTNCTSI